MSQEPEEVPAEQPPAPAASRRPVIKKRRKRKERQSELDRPDEFVEVGGTIVDWVLDRGKPIGVGLGAVLLTLLVWGIVKRVDSGNRLDAAEALFAAEQKLPDDAAAPGQPAPDPAAESGDVDAGVAALDAVAKDHAGTPQATLASLRAASVLYRAGRYEDALTRFQAAQAGKGAAAALAANGVAYSLESLDRLDEAATAFEAVRSSAEGGAREQATLDLARVYEAAGKTDEAKGLYEQFEEEFPESTLLSDAQARAAALAVK